MDNIKLGRCCTCAVTGEKGNTIDFYRAPNGKYYKSEDIYNEYMYECDCKKELHVIIFKEILKIKDCQKYGSYFNKLLSDSAIKYSELLKCLKSNKDEIIEKMPSDDCNIQTKLLFIFTYFKKTAGKLTYAGCYEIRNKTTNEVYIGESVDLFRRFATHVSDLYENKHHCVKLQNAFNKTKTISDFSIKPIYVYPIACIDKMKVKEETLYMESAYYLLYKKKSYSLYNTKNPYDALKNGDVFIGDRKIDCKKVLTLIYQDKYHIFDKELLDYVREDLKDIIDVSDILLNKAKTIDPSKSSKNTKVAKTKLIENNAKMIKDLINQGQQFYYITNIFDELAKQEIIPKYYDSQKLKKVLEENDLIKLQKKSDKYMQMIATDYAINEKLFYLKEIRLVLADESLEYKYVISEKGKRIIFDIFENYKDKENLAYISQEEQNKILSRNQESSNDGSFIM